jgi:hypothetical protein
MLALTLQFSKTNKPTTETPHTSSRQHATPPENPTVRAARTLPIVSSTLQATQTGHPQQYGNDRSTHEPTSQ